MRVNIFLGCADGIEYPGHFRQFDTFGYTDFLKNFIKVRHVVKANCKNCGGH
jgi:hypothetical protein